MIKNKDEQQIVYIISYANSVGIARGRGPFPLSLFRDHPPPIKRRRKLCYKSPDSQQKYRIK